MNELAYDEYSQIMITPRRSCPDQIHDGGRGIQRHRISLTFGLCHFSGNNKRYYDLVKKR